MLKLNKKASQGKWVDHPKHKEVKFKIRPMSIYAMKRLPSDAEDVVISAETLFDMLTYILIDWKGVGDEAGKVIKCDEANKRLFLDLDQETASFLINEASDMKNELIKAEEVKN